MNTLPEIIAEGLRLSAELEKTVPELIRSVENSAETERVYRQAKAEEYVKVRDLDEVKFAAERTAWVDAVTSNHRKARDIADGLRVAQLELIRNLRQQLSFVQTALNAHKEDQAFHRNGQQQTQPDDDIPF